jgi:hypothetical protein
LQIKNKNMEDLVKKIADLVTDDPDIFNETTVSGDVAMGMGNAPMSRPRSRKRKKAQREDDGESKKDPMYRPNPQTGKPEKGGEPAGEVLFSDMQNEDDSVD